MHRARKWICCCAIVGSGAMSGCDFHQSQSSNSHVNAGPATAAFAAYEKQDIGSQKIGDLTKDEILDRLAIARLGLALDAKCSFLPVDVKVSVSAAVGQIEPALTRLGVDQKLVTRLDDSTRTLAANLDCDNDAKTTVNRAAGAVKEMCAALTNVCVAAPPIAAPNLGNNL